jgi:hypothetical protein
VTNGQTTDFFDAEMSDPFEGAEPHGSAEQVSGVDLGRVEVHGEGDSLTGPFVAGAGQMGRGRV